MGQYYPVDPTALYVVGALLVIVGLAGTVLPVIPGTILVFGGLLVAAWADDFTRVGWIGLTIIGVLAAIAFAADFVASLLGAVLKVVIAFLMISTFAAAYMIA